jgi:4-coumarate--CoA ligase
VGDVGVVGIPHDYAGEVPLAFVVLSQDAKKSGRSEDAIRKEIIQVRLW